MMPARPKNLLGPAPPLRRVVHQDMDRGSGARWTNSWIQHLVAGTILIDVVRSQL